MQNLFNQYNFKDDEVIAICRYRDDIVAVPCDNCMSGYYARYDEAQPIIMNWLNPFKLHDKLDSGIVIDAILFVPDTEGTDMYFAVDSHDGFQIISE